LLLLLFCFAIIFLPEEGRARVVDVVVWGGSSSSSRARLRFAAAAAAAAAAVDRLGRGFVLLLLLLLLLRRRVVHTRTRADAWWRANKALECAGLQLRGHGKLVTS
jgi:hypothetical protein